MNETLGVVSALLIGVGGLAAGTFLIYTGKAWPGFGTIFADLAALVWVYRTGKRKAT